MPRAYSDDLRRKILEKYAEGKIGLKALADQFGVSYAFTKKIRWQQQQTGKSERPEQRRHGFASQITPPIEEKVRAEVRRQPDITLAELGQRLAETTQVRLSKTRWWETLGRLGLRRKKNPSPRVNATRKRTSSGGKSS
jgi:transposase